MNVFLSNWCAALALALALAVVLLLSACGGGGGGTEPAATNSDPAPGETVINGRA